MVPGYVAAHHLLFISNNLHDRHHDDDLLNALPSRPVVVFVKFLNRHPRLEPFLNWHLFLQQYRRAQIQNHSVQKSLTAHIFRIR